MAYQPQPPKSFDAAKLEDTRDPGLAIPTKITTSQQSVLDQLHNHVAFSESLIFLSGPKGAGKTTLLEVFLEQASDYANLAYIPNPSQTKPTALRSKLLRQLVSLDAYSTDDSLLEALQRNLKPGRQHLILCIDNGPSLANPILAELQELVSSRHLFNQEHRISVVIAGDASWVKRASKGVGLGANEPPITIEIPAFFKREQQWFARKLAATQGDTTDAPQRNEAQVSEWLAQTDGYPGQIQAVLEEALLQRPHTELAMQARRQRLQSEPEPTSTRQPLLSTAQWLVILIGAAALIAIAIGLYSWQGASDSELPEPSSLTEDPAQDTTTAPQALEPDDDRAATNDEQTPVVEPAPPTPQLTSEGPTAMDFEHAMDRLREQAETRPPPPEIQFQLVQPVQFLDQQRSATEVILESDDASETTPPDQTSPATEDATADELESADPYHTAYDNQALWQRDPERYVFQVAAFNSEARLMQFLAGYDHPEMAIYQTVRNQQDWYMVVVGDFSSADSARDYLATNDDLQSIQPWLKSVRLVHDDLAPVMDNSAQDTNN